MARPRTPLGTAGKVSTTAQVKSDGRWITAPQGTKPTRWRARTRYRDDDGVLREVTAFAPTKARATTELKTTLAQRSTPTKGDLLRADMAFTDAGEVWLAQVGRADSGLSDNTRGQYRSTFDRHVVGSTITGLTLREVNAVPVLRRYLQTVADEHGSGSAKSARSVVSGILNMAVNDGVLPHNATRDVRPAKADPKTASARSKTKGKRERDTRRAMTRAEREHFLEVADSHDATAHLDVADLAAWMAATGCRISEALHQAWEDVDLEAGTAMIRGTKSTSSTRLITLPPWMVERLTKRADIIGTEGLVFPSPRLLDSTKPRDRRNVARALRAILDAAGLPWATPHTLRRTVATLIDDAGLPMALAADVLGHADASFTARTYLGRKGSTAAAAAVL